MWPATAQRQLGLITVTQLARADVTRDARRTLVRRGTLIPVHPRVFRIAGAPQTRQQARLAAALAHDRAAVSHLAAAAVWGAHLCRDALPELVVPYDHRVDLEGVNVHRSRSLPAADVLPYPPFPRVTRPGRTLVDLAAMPGVETPQLEDIGADLLLGWPRDRPWLQRAMNGKSRSGARARARVDALFGEYLRDGRRPPHPGIERRLLAIIRSSPKLPLPVVHHGLITPLGTLEVDLAWPDLLLIVEADSARWHSSPMHLRTDRTRDQAAAMIGWQAIRFTWEQVTQEAGAVVDRLLKVREVRSRQLSGAQAQPGGAD